ncbi:unnamed protein product, partial [Phyllotreta striolata]
LVYVFKKVSLLNNVNTLLIFFKLSTGSTIKCWECRSDYYNKCSDTFNNETFAITECEIALRNFRGNTADMACMKIHQIERGQNVLIRRCGFINETDSTDPSNCLRRPCNPNDCYEKMCSDDCYADYCSCHDKDGCNSSTNLKMSMISWVLLFTFLLFVII